MNESNELTMSKMMHAAYATFLENWYLHHDTDPWDNPPKPGPVPPVPVEPTVMILKCSSTFDPDSIESSFSQFMEWESLGNDEWKLTFKVQGTLYDAYVVVPQLNALVPEFEAVVIDARHFTCRYPIEYITPGYPPEALAEEIAAFFAELGYTSYETDTVTYVKTDTEANAYIFNCTMVPRPVYPEHIQLYDYLNSDVNPDMQLANIDLNEDMLKYTSELFYNCTGITTVGPNAFNNVVNADNMFEKCTNLTAIEDNSFINATSVKNIFKQGISTLSISDTAFTSLRDASYMFASSNLAEYNDILNISAITNVSYLLNGCGKLTTVTNLDTSDATTIAGIFSNCSKLTTVPILDTSKVENMLAMFSGCSRLTTIPVLDTSSVTYMDEMFYGCRSLTTVPDMDTSNVTYMRRMFYGCSSLTTVNMVPTKTTVDMKSMFEGCANLEIASQPYLEKITATYNYRSAFKDAPKITDKEAMSALYPTAFT